MNKIVRLKTGRTGSVSEAEPASRIPFGTSLWREAKTRHRFKKTDRRAIQRYKAGDNAFAFMRSPSSSIRGIGRMTMGDIALAVFRTNPSKAGQVQDISIAGMAFNYVESDDGGDEPCVLDLLLADRGFYMKDLRFSVVSDGPLADDPDIHSIRSRRISVRFIDITPLQIEQLSHFLKNYTLGSA